MKVVATASRPESTDWRYAMGADHAVNHRNNLTDKFRQQALPSPDCIFCLNDSDRYFPVMAELNAPQGMICAVVSSRTPQNLNLLKVKSVGLLWEFMFTRCSYKTSNMVRLHTLLDEVRICWRQADSRGY